MKMSEHHPPAAHDSDRVPPLEASQRGQSADPAFAFPADYPTWRRLFAYLVFPVVFTGCMAGTWSLITRGIDARAAAAVFTAVGAVCAIAAEHIQPHAAFWEKSQNDMWTDAAHAVFSEILPPPVYEAMVTTGLMFVAVWIAGESGRESLWPSQWNIWAQVALAMVLSEFGQYWWHRLCHENQWFWRFHATHHSPGRLYWLNAARFHPIDTVAAYALQTLPFFLLGAPPAIFALFTVFTAVHGLFQHANIELRLGPLNWLFSMAELHRWHHSRDVRDANTNYGANIIFWDVIFGTRHLPRDREHAPRDVGFEGMPNFPQRYFGQLASPFTWRRLKREAALVAGQSPAD